jgi:hypothetical protein
MELVREQTTRIDCLPAVSSAGGITTLENEPWNEPVEYRVVVVAIVA